MILFDLMSQAYAYGYVLWIDALGNIQVDPEPPPGPLAKAIASNKAADIADLLRSQEARVIQGIEGLTAAGYFENMEDIEMLANLDIVRHGNPCAHRARIISALAAEFSPPWPKMRIKSVLKAGGKVA